MAGAKQAPLVSRHGLDCIEIALYAGSTHSKLWLESPPNSSAPNGRCLALGGRIATYTRTAALPIRRMPLNCIER
jgi:hypothetical protein